MLVVKKGEEMRRLTKGLLPFLVVIGALDILVMLEPDLSAAMMFTLLLGIILFAGGVRIGHFVALGVLLIPLLYVKVERLNYVLLRMSAFFDPGAAPLQTSYQLRQSLIEAEAVAAAAPKPNEHLLQRVPRAQLTLGLGRARRAMNDLRGAREAFERTMGDLEPVTHEYIDTSFQRRLGRARVELAFTLSSLGVSTPERIAAAKAAAEWLRRAGGNPLELAKLEDLGKE